MATAKPEKESILPPEPKLNLLQRLSKVMNEVDYIQKEKKQGMRYSIVSHDAVTAKVRPVLVKYGVVYYPVDMKMEQIGNRTQMQMVVRFVNVDDPLDYIDVVTAGYGIDEQDKGPGKAISYSVKYALLKALGLESGDDPDEDQESKHIDPSNPHIMAIDKFTAAVDAAKDEASLKQVLADHSEAMGRAAAVFGAKVQSAKQAYAARLQALRAVGKNEPEK